MLRENKSFWETSGQENLSYNIMYGKGRKADGSSAYLMTAQCENPGMIRLQGSLLFLDSADSPFPLICDMEKQESIGDEGKRHHSQIKNLESVVEEYNRKNEIFLSHQGIAKEDAEIFRTDDNVIMYVGGLRQLAYFALPSTGLYDTMVFVKQAAFDAKFQVEDNI